MTVIWFSRTKLLNCFVVCASLIKYIKIKSRISKVYVFFHKKKAHCYSMTHSFANVLYLSFCILGNCSCFYFRLLPFFKIKFLQINHPGSPSERQSLDPDQDRRSVGLHLGSNGCKRVLAADKTLHWHAKSYNR